MGRMQEYLMHGVQRMQGWIYPYHQQRRIESLRHDLCSLESSLQNIANSNRMNFPDIWNWVCSLPRPTQWEGSLMSMELCASNDNTKSILLVAESFSGGALLRFSFVLGGDWSVEIRKTLWVSEPCPFDSNPDEFSMEMKTIPLVLNLLDDSLKRGPKLGLSSSSSSTATRTLRELQDHVGLALLQHSDSYKRLFNFAFLCRLFWLCACEAAFEVGSLYFDMVGWRLELIVCKQILTVFLLSIGGDMEENFMRSLGYMFTKWMCLRSLSKFGRTWEESSFEPFTYAYADTNSPPGFWKVKCYAPILAMQIVSSTDGNHKCIQLPETEDSVLQYVLSHQQLEATIQLQYSVSLHDKWIDVEVRIDNLRCDVSQLAFGKTNGVSEERHFPSRITLTVGGPEELGSHVLLMTLNRSSQNPTRELGTQKIFKGTFGASKLPSFKASTVAASSTNISNWNFEQSGEGTKGTFDWILYDNMNGKEVASSKPSRGVLMDSKAWFKDRYHKACRPFNTRGGVVFASDEYTQSIVWRLKRDLAGQTLKWNVRACICLTYWPNSYKTSYCESRYVELCQQIDLPLHFNV